MKNKIPEYITKKADEILCQLNSTGFKGLRYKRLSSNRNIISIKITPRYRVIVRNENNTFTFSEVLSHSAYSIKIKSRRH